VVPYGLAEGALIYAADGSIIMPTSIEKLAKTGEQPEVLAYHKKKDRIVKVVAQYPRMASTEAEIVEVTLFNMHKLRCTPNHKVLTTVGPIEARDLRAGDKLVSLSAGAGIPGQFMFTANRTNRVAVAGDPVPAGKARVFDITTTTGNFVCEGIVVCGKDAK